MSWALAENSHKCHYIYSVENPGDDPLILYWRDGVWIHQFELCSLLYLPDDELIDLGKRLQLKLPEKIINIGRVTVTIDNQYPIVTVRDLDI